VGNDDMVQGNRFAFVFFGCIAFWLGLFFWGVQRMPPPPLMPPPVTMDAASLAAFAAKQAAIADDMPKFYARRGFVEVRIHNVTRPAYRPLESLAVAMGRYPKATRFYVTWGCFFGRHGSKTTVVYDRQQHSLYCDYGGGGSPWGGFGSRTVFTNVTDLALRRDAQDHKNSTRDVPYDLDTNLDIVFSDLPRYGCPYKSESIYRQTT